MQIQHSSQFVKARQRRRIVVYLMQMQNLRLRRRTPPIIFAQIVRSMNALQLCRRQFSHKETSKCDFRRNSAFCVFEPPLGAYQQRYDVHLGFIGERLVDFLLALIELFSLGVTAEALRANIGSKWAISLQRGSVDPKFQVEGVTPTNNFRTDS